MHQKYAIAIVLAVLALGCTSGQGTTTPGGGGGKDAGIVVQDFYFKMTDITDEEKASATFSVANIGSKIVSGDIHVWLHGPFLGKEPWKIEPEGTIDLSSTRDAIITGKTFYPPDTEKGVPGSVKKYDVLLSPPDVPEGTRQEYTFYAQICYPYTTSAFAEIISTSQNEFDVQEKSASTLAQTDNSKGPIKLTLSSRQNVRTSKKIPLVFNVQDTAGGYATSASDECTLDAPFTRRDKVDVSVFVDESANNIDCGDATNTATVDIIKGKGILFCSYELPETTMPKSTYYVSAVAEYKYYSRKTATITVEDAYGSQ